MSLNIKNNLWNTWDAVTSVNLNISMVRYPRRHLVCTIHCLHKQEWWLFMRWSCEKVYRHLFFDKVKCFGIDSCLYELPKHDWVDDMKLSPVAFPDVLLPHRHAGRLHWGKAESIQLCDFADGSSHYRCWSDILLIIPAICSTSFVLNSGQAIASIRSRTMCGLLYTLTERSYCLLMRQCHGIISLSVCVFAKYRPYIKWMNTVVYLVYFLA